MKKTQVALAALALVASTAALADVTIGGVFDVGVAITTKTAAGIGGTFLENGAYNDHSAFEINASDDIGGGLKSYASWGLGFNPNGQSDNPGVNGQNHLTGSTIHSNSLFNRQAFVGVSGEFGSLQAGRQLSPFVLSNVLMQNYIGMFGVARMVLAGAGGTAGAFFLDNSVQYTTPSFNGWTVTAFVTTPNGTRGNQFIAGSQPERYTSYRLGGAIGPINLTAAYHNSKTAYSGTNIGGTMEIMPGLVGSLGYISTTNTATNVKVGSWNLGGAYALTGSTTLTVQHAENDAAGGSLTLTNIMLANALSKRTTIYGGYGRGSAGIGSTIGTFGGTIDTVTEAVNAAGTNSISNNTFVVGVSHAF